MYKLGEPIEDKRIGATNYMLEMTIDEYFHLVSGCLNENEYQRKRVRNAGSIYNLLKQDLIKGCIMPPIVLAICEQIPPDGDIIEILPSKKSTIKILDGLQRSYTIKEIIEESDESSVYLHNPIRVELYTGINKIGLLYRILTLNTGQTQMTTRHQVEIIYSEYRTNCTVDGVKLIPEVESKPLSELGEYRFRDVIEGFTSYLSMDYLTLDRLDILDNVKNLERLAEESYQNTLFDDYLECYHSFVSWIHLTFPGEIDEQEIDIQYHLYAKSAIDMFNKSQSMTGFGAAIATLKKNQIISGFGQVTNLVKEIKQHSVKDGLYTINERLDKVRQYAKKIGDDQRLFFYHFFRVLFDSESDGYLDISQSANIAYKRV